MGSKSKYIPMIKAYEESLPSFVEAYEAILNLPRDDAKQRLMLIMADNIYRMQLEHKGYRKQFEVYETPEGSVIFLHDETITPEELDMHLLKLTEGISRIAFSRVKNNLV